MCGIAGIFEYHYASNPLDERELIRIRDHMQRRGPDGAGVWISPDRHAGLAHRRLAIIDLNERSAQPMASADGRYVITFNGEIYNYKSLKAELAEQGEVFRTESDTEVVLKLFARDGAAMLPKLRGMFAFGIYDQHRRTLFLARDPYGIKPLYYADSGWTVHFASQVKALLQSPRISRDAEPAGHVGFYLWGSVPEPYTLYLQIRSLPAGSYLWVDAAGAGSPRAYFSLAGTLSEASAETAHSPAQVQSAVRGALLDSVRAHLVADVPVGAFLSAGIDSGALVGLMTQIGAAKVQTITLAFEEFEGRAEDEAPLAARVAAVYGTEHSVRRVGRREFLDDLPKILEAMDQPSIDGINTWFVAKAARERGLKVAISGLGGDELFAGYRSFTDVPRWAPWLRLASLLPGAGWIFRQIAAPIARAAKLSPKLPGVFSLGGGYAGAYLLKRGLFLPSELHGMLDADVVREGLSRLHVLDWVDRIATPAPKAPTARVAALEAGIYMRNQLLRDSDWAGMAHSLEIRLPLVDSFLLRSLAPYLNAQRITGKELLAASPATALPPEVTARSKTGFGTPISQWLQQSDDVAAWRRRPELLHEGCPWARRWAYNVMSTLQLA